MMELGFYMASTCFATQFVSINLLNKRTLFAKLKKKRLHINAIQDHLSLASQPSQAGSLSHLNRSLGKVRF